MKIQKLTVINVKGVRELELNPDPEASLVIIGGADLMLRGERITSGRWIVIRASSAERSRSMVSLRSSLAWSTPCWIYPMVLACGCRCARASVHGLASHGGSS